MKKNKIKKKKNKKKKNKEDSVEKNHVVKKNPLLNNLNIITQHWTLLTTDFSKTMTPKFEKSVWIGISCFFTLLPLLFINGESGYATFLRILCLIQTPIAFLSDYTFSREDHIIHGIDRITATICLMMFIYIAFYYNTVKQSIIYISVPILAIVLAKYNCNTCNEECYTINQVLWHFTTAIIVSYILYSLNKKGILL